MTIVPALATLAGAGVGVMALPVADAGAVAATTLFVSPSANIHLNNNHHNCATAGYNSVQAAVKRLPTEPRSSCAKAPIISHWPSRPASTISSSSGTPGP